MTDHMQLCVCGHGWLLHRTDLKRPKCGVYEGSDFSRCPCSNFEPGE